MSKENSMVCEGENGFSKSFKNVTSLVMSESLDGSNGKPPSRIADLMNDVHVVYSLIIDQLNEKSKFLHSKELKTGTNTEDGFAISAFSAMIGFKDLNRAVKFLWGVREAVREKLKENPEERVIIIYAGCGPFAPLVLPLTSIFSAEEVGFFLIDIHEIAIDLVGSIIKELGLEDYVIDAVVEDASYFQIPKDIAESVDVVVIETMLPALFNEPQVSISRNIIPQVPEEATLVPESIRLDLVLELNNQCDSKECELIDHHNVKTIFEVNKTMINAWEETLPKNSRTIPGIGFTTGDVVPIPITDRIITQLKGLDLARVGRVFGFDLASLDDGKSLRWSIWTEIITSGEPRHVLRWGECVITDRMNLGHFVRKEGCENVKHFEYVMGENPQLVGVCDN